MTDQTTEESRLNSLLEIGFREIGSWHIAESGLVLNLNEMSDAVPALYAFVVAGEVRYVGKTARTLQQRLYGYLKPGDSQRTSIKVRGHILDALLLSSAVEIFGFSDLRVQRVGRFVVNSAAALEDDIIAQLKPAWNGGEHKGRLEATRSVKAPDSSARESTSDVQPRNKATDASGAAQKPQGPYFSVLIGQTYFRQGFFNVPVDFARYFGDHDSAIAIHLPDNAHSIQGKVNRTVNATYAPRIMGGVGLRNWIQENLKVGGRLRVVVKDFGTIYLSRG